MNLVESPASGRTPGRRELPRPGRRETLLGAIVGVIAVSAFVAWEIARPTLPVSFELAAASQVSGAASWLGRLPMASAALGGLYAIYTLLARTAERRGAAYAVAILATMPAWFVHGRTMTGAIVPMALSAAVLAGTGVALLDRDASRWRRGGALALAAFAAAGSLLALRWGIPNRGVVSVVGVPVVAVGLAGAFWPGTNARGAAAAIVVGGVLMIAGAVVGIWRPDGEVSALLLGARAVATSSTSFDAPVTSLAYGLVPWTPFVPFALARRPNSAGHLAVMIGAVLAIAAHAALAPRSGPAVILGAPCIAAAVALMLRTLEDTPRPAAPLVASVIVIGWLIAHDVGMTPDRVLVAFGAPQAPIAAAHAAASSLAVRSSMWLCMVLAAVALVAPRTWLPSGRGLAIVFGGVLAGLVLRVHAYPALLARLSPGAAFDAWADRHRAGEPLGLVGVDRRSLAFLHATEIVAHADAPSAGAWLASMLPDMPERRFLALDATELPRVNAAFRARRGANVPVLAGHEGSTLLAVSAMVPGEHTQNPLDAIVLSSRPQLPHLLGAVLEDRLDAVGWELLDARGRRLEAVPRGSRHAHIRLFLSARSGPIHGYCTFLHVDHVPSRFSAEHREHAYPMSVWRSGDVIVDDFDIKLPAQFRAGDYKLFWGVGVLPCEDDRRMAITAGPSDGHGRIPGGILEVR